MLVLSQKNQSAINAEKLHSGDGRIILSALLGGAIAIYVTMFITRYKLKNLLYMIAMPLISVINVWMFIATFRFATNFIII
jgi:uncharacterized membrane protein YsdA (DUF1294 family)